MSFEDVHNLIFHIIYVSSYKLLIKFKVILFYCVLLFKLCHFIYINALNMKFGFGDLLQETQSSETGESVGACRLYLAACNVPRDLLYQLVRVSTAQ